MSYPILPIVHKLFYCGSVIEVMYYRSTLFAVKIIHALLFQGLKFLWSHHYNKDIIKT